MARPTKLTPETQESIMNYIRMGVPYEEAALKSGISKVTFYNWKNRGEKARSGIFRQFFNSLKEANAHAMVALLGRVHKAGMGGEIKEFKKTEYDAKGNIIKVIVEDRLVPPLNFAPNAWILERRWPKQFGRYRMTDEGNSDNDNTPLPWSNDPANDPPDPLGQCS